MSVGTAAVFVRSLTASDERELYATQEIKRTGKKGAAAAPHKAGERQCPTLIRSLSRRPRSDAAVK